MWGIRSIDLATAPRHYEAITWVGALRDQTSAMARMLNAVITHWEECDTSRRAGTIPVRTPSIIQLQESQLLLDSGCELWNRPPFWFSLSLRGAALDSGHLAAVWVAPPGRAVQLRRISDEHLPAGAAIRNWVNRIYLLFVHSLWTWSNKLKRLRQSKLLRHVYFWD